MPRVFHMRGNRFWRNFISLIRLFIVRPLPDIPLRLHFNGQVIQGRTAYDGFFRFDWTPEGPLSPGWHTVHVCCCTEAGEELSRGGNTVLVPHITQLAVISDIDDTVMQSYSATVFRRLYELLFRNPERRRIFREAADHYSRLALAQTNGAMPNPFFYVSSSEWNLYDYLQRIFRHNGLPEGIFLLDQVKHWYQLLQTGKTGHSGKLIRISRILQAFPKQRFVLLGDNSQRDPQIYEAIAAKHPAQVYAVYIRNVRASKTADTEVILSRLERMGIRVCMFRESTEAISHGKRNGLID